MADVKLIFNDGTRREVAVPSGSFYIGRSQENNLVIERAGLSRRHAVIGNLEDGVRVADCESANGTFLNGTPVRTQTLVKDGDVISLGQVLDIKVEIGVAIGARPATPKASSHLPMALIGVMAVILLGALVLIIAMGRPRTTAPPVPQPTPETTQSEGTNPVPSASSGASLGSSGGAPNCESISNDQVELAAKQVLRRISIDKQDYAFPAGKPLDDLRSEVARHCGSASLAASLSALKAQQGRIAAACGTSMDPDMVLYATLAAIDGSPKTTPVETALAIIPVLKSLRITFEDNTADSTLIAVAALKEGVWPKGGHPLLGRMRRAVTNPFTQRNIWYLHQTGAIDDQAYGLVVRFLALGVIARNPRPFGIDAPALN
jgi:pSer/pThr/pTyr-binding forkhead associated (FHA) protein